MYLVYLVYPDTDREQPNIIRAASALRAFTNIRDGRPAGLRAVKDALDQARNWHVVRLETDGASESAVRLLRLALIDTGWDLVEHITPVVVYTI